MEGQSQYTVPLQYADLDQLLGASTLFPSQHGEIPDLKANEVNELLQSKCTLYQIAEKGEKNKVPPLLPSKRSRKQREDTAGTDWYNMKAPDLTPELKQELEAIRLRRHLDPKRFYRRGDVDQLPKYFQIGTMVRDPTEKIPKGNNQRKKASTIVEQLLQDDQQLGFSTKKWLGVMKKKSRKAFRKKLSRGVKKSKLGFK